MAYDKSKTKEIKDYIIKEMVNGKSLSSIVNNDDKMPCYMTIFNWLNPKSDYHDEEFLYNYTYATKIRSEIEFEQILNIADSTADDVIMDDNGNPITNHNVINRDRLRIDARKWRLGKMQPKKYGDKLDLTSNGDHINMTESERLAKIAELKDKLKGNDI